MNSHFWEVACSVAKADREISTIKSSAVETLQTTELPSSQGVQSNVRLK